jgi:hypothetical protein
MAVDLTKIAIAVNVFGEPYVTPEQGPRFAVYPDTEHGVVTAATLAKGPIPEGNQYHDVEDDWLYGDEALAFLATVDAD